MISLPTIALLAALSNPGQPVLLDFYADWCGPCRSMDPTVRKLVADGYPVRKVNIDREKQLAQQYRVDRVPTYVLVAGGREVARVVGPTSYADLAGMFGRAPVPAQPVAAGLQPAAAAGPTGGGAPASRSLAMQATVRLRVEDGGGNSVGTGTIIDAHGEEALVMTCAHVFRESKGEGNISVDLFVPGARNPVIGKVIDFDLEKDVALFAIRPGVKVTPVPVASSGYQARQGDRVFSIGCDRGADPTIRESQVTNLNKYVGPANIEVAGQPVIGRSGGGLFTDDGQLIGVCNLADPKDNEGIYAATSLLHGNLAKNNLAWIYEGNAPQVASAETPPVARSETAPTMIPPPDMAKEMPRAPLSDLGRSGTPLSSTPPAATPLPLASLLSQTSGDTELILILRSKADPQGKSQVYYLDQPSRSLLNHLALESGGQRDPVVLQADRTGNGQRPDRTTDRGPVVRAQTE